MSGHLPLEGLRVLDLASFIAGPVATTVMGDYGAEVIKIEPPGEGDPQRKLGQAHSVPQHPVNFCWHMTNRNKRAIVLDLKHAQGRAVFERLAGTADVMVVNFPLKVRTRLRMRYEDVAPINPRLIYASMTGYGEAGPDAEQPGFDSTAFFARSGPARRADARGRPARLLVAGAGRPDGRHEPVRRHRHGAPASRAHRPGQRSQHLAPCRRPVVQRHPGAGRAARRLCGAAAAAHQAAERARQPVPHVRRPLDPAHHRARGQALARALQGDGSGSTLLKDPRFQTTDDRRAHAPELAAILDPVIRCPSRPEWRKRLRHHEITFGLLGVLRDVPHDHQAVANGAVVESRQHDMPRTLSAPIRMSFAPEPVTPGRGPGHGEHTDDVLSELGYSPAEIDALRTAGALG